MSNQIFALDIGTQSVTGVIVKKNKHTYTLIDYCMIEHKERAMLDGQIHDIVKVASVIEKVKNTLEEKHGKLSSVSVAAAGRALKTVQAEANISLHKQPITDKEMIKHLELSAVQKAQNKIIKKTNSDQPHEYYCVGYSVLHYKLDTQPIGSLIDQSGDQASVEIIATFLPRVVIESLLASLKRAHLKMEALTLEPIAAIHVLIPESMRRLNVALVDIGAGTSDIAITNQGTVIAYGMVATAGDEITEAISDQYLLDFPKAEEAKRSLVNHGQATVQDILGFETIITYENAVQLISNSIENLAQYLAEEIFRLNKKSPQAVMLIGGGSLTPNIANYLARKLSLPENRVAVRDINAIQDIENISLLPEGPGYITPLGIALSSNQNPVKYTTATVNEQVIRLFEMNKLTVGDCLVHAGIEINKLYGKPGLAYMIQVNDQNITLPGNLGEPPLILCNGEKVTVKCPVNDGDHITLQKGKNGEKPHTTIKELLGDIETLTVYINKKQHKFEPVYYVNQMKVDSHYILQDNDYLVFKQPETVNDILLLLNEGENIKSEPFVVSVNGEYVHLDIGQVKYTLNGKQVPLSHSIKPNDSLTIAHAQVPTVNDLLDQLEYSLSKQIKVTFNDEHVVLKQKIVTVIQDGKEVDDTAILHPNTELTITSKNKQPFIFQDIFRYVDINMSDIDGHYKLYINDKKATFFDQIFDGDSLAIH